MVALNPREASWYHADGRPAYCQLEGDAEFSRLGINIVSLGRGEPIGMYHWEANQEDFLVLLVQSPQLACHGTGSQ